MVALSYHYVLTYKVKKAKYDTRSLQILNPIKPIG